MVKKQERTKGEKRLLKAKKERDRVQQDIKSSSENFTERIKERMSQDGHQIRIDLNNTVKMSAVILDFAGPLLRAAETKQQERSAVELAIIAWNMSLLPKDEQKKALRDVTKKVFMKNLASSEEDDEVLSYLLQRKKIFFSGIKRLIMDYDIVDTPQGLHLNVVSSVMRDDKPDYGNQ